MHVEELKERLRQETRIRVRKVAGELFSRRAAERAQGHFLREFPPMRGMRVALYFAVRGEVSTEKIRCEYLASGVHLYYPRVAKGGTLAFYPHRVGDVWETGPYGIPEPPCPPGARPRRDGFDVVVVPGIAFDRKGRRLGHGYGYYDRFLGELPESVLRVGLAYAHQVVPEVPVDAWDVPLHALVTEDGLIRVASEDAP